MKYCKDCKYFNPDKSILSFFGLVKNQNYYEFAKCSKFSMSNRSDDEALLAMVSEKRSPSKVEFLFCTVARKHRCVIKKDWEPK